LLHFQKIFVTSRRDWEKKCRMGIRQPVSLTPAASLPPVSTTLAKIVEKFATGVADTCGKFATGVVDTGGAP
jgi:hypothetical protein